MSDKKLMNEQLPAPQKSEPAASARERVLSHMKSLVKVGAASVVVSACTPFAVVDPLPPPARCKTNNDVLSELSAVATRADGGAVITLAINAKIDEESGVLLISAPINDGGTSMDVVELNGKRLVANITSSAPTVFLTLHLTCDGANRNVSVLIDTATLNVTLSKP